MKSKNETYRDYAAIGAAVLIFAVMAIYSLASLGNAASETPDVLRVPGICGFGLSFTLDGFRIIYGNIAAFMWMMATIFSPEYLKGHKHQNRYYVFLLATLLATLGVFLSADLFTTFIFFEVMSFTSYVWVVQEEDKAAVRAAETYLAVAVIGGLVMLMGIFLVWHELGTLEIARLSSASSGWKNPAVRYAAGICLFIGFGAKAGAFPLHIWLPKAHPVAPAPESALLSGILTKTGIFGILIVSSGLFPHDARWGTIVLAVGVLTMFGGALLAVFSVNLKRTLACSSMSQIGFILVGIGMQGLLGSLSAQGIQGTQGVEGAENALAALAAHGTLLHMVNHSLIKLVLFMAAGVVFMNTHALNLNEIRGFGRKKPLLKAVFLVGALAIAGVPLFGGYISKTLLHESIVAFGGGSLMTAVEWIFLLSGGLTAAYMAKLFVAVFVETNEDEKRQEEFDNMTAYMDKRTTFALTGSAAVLLVWGLFPHAIMERAARLGQGFLHLTGSGEEVSYLKTLSGAMISLGIGLLVYALIQKVLRKKKENGTWKYVDRWPKWLDMEELLYRPVLLKILPAVFGTLSRILDSFVDILVVLLRKSVYAESPIPHPRKEGNALTAAVGHLMNGWQSAANHLWKRKNPSQKDYVHAAAILNEKFKESNMIIRRSLSFGLLLVCIGLCMTLVYIIFW